MNFFSVDMNERAREKNGNVMYCKSFSMNYVAFNFNETQNKMQNYFETNCAIICDLWNSIKLYKIFKEELMMIFVCMVVIAVWTYSNEKQWKSLLSLKRKHWNIIMTQHLLICCSSFGWIRMKKNEHEICLFTSVHFHFWEIFYFIIIIRMIFVVPSSPAHSNWCESYWFCILELNEIPKIILMKITEWCWDMETNFMCYNA